MFYIAGSSHTGTLSATDPIVTTNVVTDITSYSATCGGSAVDGGQSITHRGVCWSTGSTPTVLDSKTDDGPNSGNFTSLITGLESSTVYYVRAYATNIIGTNYGEEIFFTTITQGSYNLSFGVDSDILAYGDNINDTLIWD